MQTRYDRIKLHNAAILYGHCDTVDFDKENYDHVEYTDLRNNPHIGIDSVLFNKRYLKFGSWK